MAIPFTVLVLVQGEQGLETGEGKRERETYLCGPNVESGFETPIWLSARGADEKPVTCIS